MFVWSCWNKSRKRERYNFDQYPFVNVYRNTCIEKEYVDYLYGYERNWFYFLLWLMGALAYICILFINSRLLWKLGSLGVSLFLIISAQLWCCKCFVRKKCALEVTLMIAYVIIGIRNIARDMIVDELEIFPLKTPSCVFDLIFFLAFHPRIVVFFPLLVLMVGAYTLFIPLYFWNKVDDFRFFTTILAYTGTQLMIFVFLHTTDFLNRKNFIRKMKIEGQNERYQECHQRSVDLLENILPSDFIPSIFDGELSKKGFVIRKVQNGAILQSDIVSFTILCSKVSSGDIVFFLDRYFCVMDNIITEFELEKIKTCGDSILVMGGRERELGVSLSNPNYHFLKIVLLGLAMIESMVQLGENSDLGKFLLGEGMDVPKIRVGVASGTLFPAVFGDERHLSFDVFGKAFSDVSYLESSSSHQGVHVNETVYINTMSEFEYIPKPGSENEGIHSMRSLEDGDDRQRTYMTEYLPQVCRVKDRNLRKKVCEVIYNALTDSKYVTKREELIRSSSSKSPIHLPSLNRLFGRKKRNQQQQQQQKDKYFHSYSSDESFSEEDFKKRFTTPPPKKRNSNRVSISSNDPVSQFPEEELNLSFESAPWVCSNNSTSIQNQETLRDEFSISIPSTAENPPSKVDTISIEPAPIFTEEDKMMIFKSEKEKLFEDSFTPERRMGFFERILSFFCCVLCFSPTCFLKTTFGPSLSLGRSGLSLCSNLFQVLRHPVSRQGWCYLFCIFCPLSREMKFGHYEFRKSKHTFRTIFTFGVMERLIVISYFITTNKMEYLWHSGLMIVIYIYLVMSAFSIFLIFLTILPCKYRIAEKHQRRTKITPYTPQNEMEDPTTFGGNKSTGQSTHDGSTKNSRKQVKLFEYLLYRPMIMYPLLLVNLFFIPFELILCAFFVENVVSKDLYLFLFFFGFIFINWSPGVHFCFKFGSVIILLLIQLLQIVFSQGRVVPGIVTDLDFLIRQSQYQIFLLVFILCGCSFFIEFVKRSSFDKKMRISKENRKLLEKRFKNRMIIQSVLPKEVIDELVEKKPKKSSLGKNNNFHQIVAEQRLENVCLCFIKVTCISDALQVAENNMCTILSRQTPLAKIRRRRCKRMKRERIQFIDVGSQDCSEEEREEENYDFEVLSPSNKERKSPGQSITDESEILEEMERRSLFLVQFLTAVFCEFDRVLDGNPEFGCTKIKSIQEAYLYLSNKDNKKSSRKCLKDVIQCSLLCIDRLKRVKKRFERGSTRMYKLLGLKDVRLKIGVHLGSCTSGVVGNVRWLWDCFGDSLNTCSRLCSTSEENRIQMLESIAKKHRIEVRSRGFTFLKGKGRLKTAFVGRQ